MFFSHLGSVADGSEGKKPGLGSADPVVLLSHFAGARSVNQALTLHSSTLSPVPLSALNLVHKCRRFCARLPCLNDNVRRHRRHRGQFSALDFPSTYLPIEQSHNRSVVSLNPSAIFAGTGPLRVWDMKRECLQSQCGCLPLLCIRHLSFKNKLEDEFEGRRGGIDQAVANR